jgi:hypothetical protein
MTENEVLQVIMHANQLRSNTEYRNAFRLMQGNRPEKMAAADKKSDEYAAIRILIGTWEAIAILASGFNAAQRKRFFKSHPVSLMWQSLEPAIKVIRSSEGAAFAQEFEALYKQYPQATGKPGTKAAYASGAPQGITAGSTP